MNSKWTKDKDIKPKTIKHMEENSQTTGFCDGFENLSPVKKETNVNINKWDCQNHNEMPSHMCENGTYQKTDTTSFGKDVEENEPSSTLLVGI